MADDPLKTPTIADAVAGVQLSDPFSMPTPADIPAPGSQGAVNRFTTMRDQADNARRIDTSFLDKGLSVLRDLPSVQFAMNVHENFARPYLPDPNWSTEQYKVAFDEATKNLQQDYWPWLQGATSKAEFDSLYSRAKSLQDSQQTFHDLSHMWTPPWLIGQILDPVSLAIGGPFLKGGLKAADALAKGTASRIAINSVAGGAMGGAMEAFRAGQGYPTDAANYLSAIGMGMAMGGIVGHITRNPATQAEAAVAVKVGKDLRDKYLTGPSKPLLLEHMPEEVQRARTQEMFSAEERQRARAQAEHATPRDHELPAPVKQLPAPVDPVAEAADAIARGDIQGAVQSAQKLLQPPEQLKALEAPKATPDVEFHSYAQKIAKDPAAPVPPALDAALKDLTPPAPKPGPLPVPENMKSNPNFIGDWMGTDGGTYRITADAQTGLYRVTKVGKGVVAKELADVKEAVSLIPLTNAADIVMPKINGKLSQGAAIKLGKKYTLQANPEDGLHYRIQDGENIAGDIHLKAQPGGRFEVDYVTVEPAYRGQGLSQKAYDAIEKDLGIKMAPSGILLEDGYKLWLKRDPSAVEFHQKVGANWLSPKRILADTIMAEEHIAATRKALAEAEAGSARARNLELSIKAHEIELKELQKALKRVPKGAMTEEALARQFQFAPAPGPLKSGVAFDVQETLNRILPRGWKGQVKDGLIDLPGGSTAYGVARAAEKIVEVALAGGRAFDTMFHEALHALNRHGAFSKSDWAKLEKAAARFKGMTPETETFYHKYYTQFGLKPELVQRLVNEERIAAMVGQYLSGKRFGGAIDHLFDSALKILRQVRDALHIKGFRTYQDVMEDIRSGKLADQPERPLRDRTNFQDVANPNLGPITAEDSLTDPAFRSVKDNTTPRSAEVRIFGIRIPRFDFEAVTGTSRNPIARLFSGHFVNNAVGMSDHSVTPTSAFTRRDQAVGKYMNEFASTYAPAWKEWAKANNIKLSEMVTAQKRFREEVGMYVAGREGLPDSSYNAGTQRLGNKVRDLLKQHLKDAKDSGVAGFENIEENVNYLWRQFDNSKVQNKINVHGMDTVVKMVSGAIQSAQPWIPAQYLQKIANGYVKTIYNEALGLGEDWNGAITSKDFTKLKSVLERHTGLNANEIQDVMDRWRTRPPESGMTHVKHKMFLDESFVLQNAPTKTGQVADLAFKDLLNNDIGELFHRYTQRVQGRVALAKMEVKHPDTGVPLMQGIKSEEDFEGLMKLMRQYGTDYLKNRDPNFQKILDRDEEYFRFFFDRIRGVPDPRQHTEYASWLRRVRAFNVTRLLGSVGIAQLGEQGQMVGQLGVKATIFGKIPGFRRIIDAAGDSRLRDLVAREVESIGIGGERLHGWAWKQLDDLGQMPYEVRPDANWKRWLDNSLEFGQKATFEMSGMAVIQQQQMRAAAVSVMSWFSDAFVKRQAKGDWAGGMKRRLAQLGVDTNMADRIGAEMQANAAWKQTGPNKKLSSLNLQNWSDVEARTHFEEAVFRYTNKLIQQGDLGSSAFWMSDPTAKTIFQFRGFPFQAWANQFQYNMHMRDFGSLMAFVWGVAWNAAVRGMQIKAVAMTRSDRDAYEQRFLTPFELGKAGFERAGMSSIIPMTIDTALALAGQKGMFNARSSGLGTSAFGNPTTGLLDDLQKGVGGMADSVFRGRPLSQAEVRAFANALPFMNQIQWQMLLSSMISGMPERAPKAQPVF